MKTSTIRSAVLGLALLASAVGCAKSTDLGKMQEETIATVKIYNGELDALQRRYDELAATRGSASAANKLLEEAGQAITTGRTTAASAPTSVAAAAKSGNADALTQEHYALVDKLEHSIANAKDNLAAYETYTDSVAFGGAPRTPAPVANPTPDTPTANDGSTGAPPAGGGIGIPCTNEIALQCPEGQIDACMKTPGATVHACVAK